MEEMLKNDNASRKFIRLLIDRIDDIKLKKYSEKCNYQYEIIKQYRNIEFLINIGEFYIIIVDKIELEELSHPMLKYIQELTEKGVKEKNIFTCHYQMFEDSECVYKFVDSVIKRNDIISLLEKEDKSLELENYYLYLKNIDKYSSKRDIMVNNLMSQKSDIRKSISTSFCKELENKENMDIIGWEYNENSKEIFCKYSSKKLKNLDSKNFEYLYIEIVFGRNENLININLVKKNKKYKMNLEKSKIETKYYYKNYPNINEKVYICGQVIEEKLGNKLKEFDVSINLETKERIYKNIDDEKINFVKLVSLDINNITLIEIEKIMGMINNRLMNLRFIV